jgi:hypothetical protein
VPQPGESGCRNAGRTSAGRTSAGRKNDEGAENGALAAERRTRRSSEKGATQGAPTSGRRDRPAPLVSGERSALPDAGVRPSP